MRLIDVYCIAFGQLVNSDKSSLYCTPNMSEEKVFDLCTILLGVVATQNSGQYLGLPTIWGRSKKASLSFIKGDLLIRFKARN